MTFDKLVAIAPLMSFVVAVTSALVAFGAFIYTRKANRRRATLDMVMRTFLDYESQEKYQEFKIIMAKERDPVDCFKIASLVDASPENASERNAVVFQLNSYELIALGIRRKIFDEAFYKLWFHGQFTKDYQGLMPLIEAITEKRPSVYCEYTALYARWMRNKHPVNQPNRFKLAWWAFTAQHGKLEAARTALLNN